MSEEQVSYMLMGETILSNKLKTLHLKEREGGRTEGGGNYWPGCGECLGLWQVTQAFGWVPFSSLLAILPPNMLFYSVLIYTFFGSFIYLVG